MKGSSKPISSPGRTEKQFPPPLMRFLRTNVGNKSRGRTRNASPIMFMRKNKNNVAIEKTQEPSSPKVTCIGQVRVRRSSKSSSAGGGGRFGSRRRSNSTRKQQKQKRIRCCWKLNRPKSLISVLKKWVCCCFRFGYCGKRVETVDSSSRIESTTQRRVSTSSVLSSTTTTTAATEIDIENGNEIIQNFSNPPKNALILTRCRSAPYRSSSLASRFWSSPLNDNNNESQMSPDNLQQLEQQEQEDKDEKNPLPENPNGDLASRKSEETQSSINGGNSSIREEEEEEKIVGGDGYVHPLLLTRCKSEPARTGERLNPTRFTEESHPPQS